jgi:hypothetical protein
MRASRRLFVFVPRRFAPVGSCLYPSVGLTASHCLLRLLIFPVHTGGVDENQSLRGFFEIVVDLNAGVRQRAEFQQLGAVMPGGGTGPVAGDHNGASITHISVTFNNAAGGETMRSYALEAATLREAQIRTAGRQEPPAAAALEEWLVEN